MRTNSAKPRRWGRGVTTSLLVLVVAVLGLLLVQGGVRAAGTFNPDADVDLSTYNSDENPNITTTFDVPGEDYNYGQMNSFTPVEFFPDEDVPVGAKVGTLSAVATLGLLNGPCSTPLMPNFTMYWATVDTSSTVTFSEQFVDNSGDGLHDGIDQYPDFIDRILGGIQPIQRMYGDAKVAGQDVSISFVVLDAGDLPGYSSAWGRASVTVLNDIGDPASLPTPGEQITDFCSPLSTDIIIYGLSQNNPATPEDEAGYQVRRNPPYGGTYTFRWYAESMPDADGDGYENYLDTCPFDVNEDNSPKLDGGSDNDGIDRACEPEGGAAIACWGSIPPSKLIDCDEDGFFNRGDNCPLVANPTQADGDTDSIGDDCDQHPNTPDGQPIEWLREVDVEISGPEPGQDSDGDGVDDVTEKQLGSCPDDPCGDWFCSGTEAADSEPEHETVVGSCNDGEDNDKDGYVDDIDGGCADDTDEDGVSDDGEEELGSDPDDDDSLPEDASVCDVCTDRVDNDGDGDIDAADAGCVVAATATPTPTPTEVEGTPTPEVTVIATPTPEVEMEYCGPVMPGTYYGLVRIDGQPAAAGYELTASIEGTQWSSTIISAGRYAMDIPDYLPVQEPCFEGGTITFELNGMACTPVQEGGDQFAAGLQNVDLNCAPAVTPVPTPEVTPTPALTPTVTATPAPATPTVTPAKPPITGGGGGLADPSQGLPLWAMVLAGWVGLMTVAGLGTLVAGRRR